MTEREFDELWQRAEGENYGRRLAEEYPSWRQKQRRIKGFALATVVVAVVAFPMFTTQFRQTHNYENVYCNKAGIADDQWATLAAEMLMES